MNIVNVNEEEWQKLQGGGTKTPYEHRATKSVVVYVPNNINSDNWTRIVKEEFTIVSVLKAFGFQCLDLELVHLNIDKGKEWLSIMTLASPSFHDYATRGAFVVDKKIPDVSTWRAFHPREPKMFWNLTSLDSKVDAAMWFVLPFVNDIVKAKQLGISLPLDSINAVILTKASLWFEKRNNVPRVVLNMPYNEIKQWWVTERRLGTKYGPINTQQMSSILLNNQMDLLETTISPNENGPFHSLIHYFDSNLDNPFTGLPLDVNSELVFDIKDLLMSMASAPYARLLLFDLTSKTRPNLVTWTGYKDPSLTPNNISFMISDTLYSLLLEVLDDDRILADRMEPKLTKKCVELACQKLDIAFDSDAYDASN